MKKLCILGLLLFSSSIQAQYYYIMYVSVAQEDVAEFERKETQYWAKVAQNNIDKGQQTLWALMKKVGTAGTNEVNYAFVNGFPTLEAMANPQWDAAALDGMDPADAASPYRTYEIHNYKILDNIDGEGGKYWVFNYARPKNLSGFIAENQKMWKPFHQKAIRSGSTGMTDWGMGYKLYPSGQDESTIMTWDGYANLKDAMHALDGSRTDWNPPKGSKMSEYDPDGFRLRVIWEQVKAIN
ncbi:MAG: hypothetical protein ACON47_04775 [Flavobacteriaceae bacterium]